MFSSLFKGRTLFGVPDGVPDRHDQKRISRRVAIETLACSHVKGSNFCHHGLAFAVSDEIYCCHLDFPSFLA